MVQGRYRVTSVLGKGRFPATYLVTDDRLQGKRRALKELPRDLYDEHTASRSMGSCTWCSSSGARRVSRASARPAAAPSRQGGWCRGCTNCEVLAYLHGRTPPIVHRDLKPENILLDEDDRIMLIGFGIAKESADLAVTRQRNGSSRPERRDRDGLDYSEGRKHTAVHYGLPARLKMKVLDTVVLEKDLPSQGLRRGDVGAVMEVYVPDGVEVEFVTGSGRTQALVTLKAAEVRLITDTDILAVRSLRAA
ncbi:MAG: DUF4926 domain-containing protein [Pseudomonadota bacterium]|nr:DUF4926 domain-containing protein [Pseudomonadota bacterium]